MVSTSLSLRNSYNYPVYRDQSASKKSDEQQKISPFKPIHSVWSFFKSNTLASAELIFQEQQKVIKNWEESLSTFYIFEFQIYCIESFYSIEETEKIQNFLEVNRFLAPLLFTAYFKIKKYFPDATVLLGFDSEYKNDQRLISTILTGKLPDEAFQQLQQLDDQWWLDALGESQMMLSIGLEFK